MTSTKRIPAVLHHIQSPRLKALGSRLANRRGLALDFLPAPWSDRFLRWRYVLAFALSVIFTSMIWFGFDTMPGTARLALMVFALAIVGWSVLKLPETPVAIAGGLALIGLKATTPEHFYAGMGDDLIWLLIGAFILAAVLKTSGVAERFALRAIEGATSVQNFFVRLTWVIIATAFVIPSTSGRAALLLPLFVTLAGVIRQPALVRAMALLFPTVVLLSACASLLGAGAHLVAVDFISRSDSSTDNLGYLQWMLLGAPFAIASSFIAMQVILRQFVPENERCGAVQLPEPSNQPLTGTQWRVIAITTLTIALWSTNALHGVDAAVIAMVGALLATAKCLTGSSMKDAVKQVEWNLVLFLAATLVMGEALIESGAAQWIAAQALQFLPQALRQQPLWIVLMASVVSLLAHIVITSRTARAMVLIPTVALPLAANNFNTVAIIFLTVVASGFCQTFSVSAKPVALYSKQEVGGYSDSDLFQLSVRLLPWMLALLLVFSLWVWPALGLPLTTQSLTCR
jgi:solute carrier family 13 (sodium-dependent dicarboxylate transporter), member 2/3/5